MNLPKLRSQNRKLLSSIPRSGMRPPVHSNQLTLLGKSNGKQPRDQFLFILKYIQNNGAGTISQHSRDKVNCLIMVLGNNRAEVDKAMTGSAEAISFDLLSLFNYKGVLRRSLPHPFKNRCSIGAEYFAIQCQ